MPGWKPASPSGPTASWRSFAAIGGPTAQAATHPFDTDYRTKSIEFQKLAVEALPRWPPERGKEWASSLALVAEGWLKEAEFREVRLLLSLGPRVRRPLMEICII